MAGRPAKFDTPEEMQAAIDAYFKACDEHKSEYVNKDGKKIELHKPKPYTMTGLSIALGFESRQSLVDYKKRGRFSDTIKKARQRVEEQVEEAMLASSGVVAGIIFNAKNNFGWVDKSEQKLTVNTEKPMLGGAVQLQPDDPRDNSSNQD